MIQEQYWKELYQLKVHIGFIELLLERAEYIDRMMKITLAVSSSVSIGSWAIWSEFSYMWGAIIALSQIISAINPFLPYSSRIKSYSSLLRELEELMTQSEIKWYSISEGRISFYEINKARFDIRKAKQKSIDKYIQTTIPSASKLQDKAEKFAGEYFYNFYFQQEERS
ncbi:hypothetical protein [Serratia sp. FGI94]|uniref:hypothetical protein n=1 Tax=Serratia sp. FGI94 TaxID=671990 RepID=UPI000C79BDD4|nr:hypothetical protein [Serratia sp. FGI94]